MRSINAKEFKKAMIEANIDSYTELSDVTGLDKTSISSIVKGERNPNYDTIVKFIEALHLTYEEIGIIFFANELTGTQV